MATDEQYARLLAYICERVTVSSDVVARILVAESDYWRERPALVNELLGLDEETTDG